MATLRQRRRANTEEARYTLSDLAYMTSVADYYPMTTWSTGNTERVGEGFRSYVQEIYKANGIVAACMTVRESIFAEVRFRYATVNNGKMGALFGTQDLRVLEQPFGPTSTTGDLAVRMIQDADIAGNFYAVRRGDRLWRRRPDKVCIVLSGDPCEEEFPQVVGFTYYPRGVSEGNDFITYMPNEMVHWTPKPDPMHEYRGMSWLTPILREISSDSAATDHKLEFFGNAATPNMVVKTPPDVMTADQFKQFKADMDEAHVGRGNRHKTLYLVPGADVTVVGQNFQQMEFSEIQGRDEDRIASAAGIPAVILGLKESMQGAALGQSNYAQARRRLADITMRPLYRSAASALANVAPPPPSQFGSAMLWYDDSQVAAFREDRADAASILQTQAATIKSLIDAGFEPKDVQVAVDTGDFSSMKHTGLYSVQLQEPGSPKLPQPGTDSAAGPAA